MLQDLTIVIPCVDEVDLLDKCLLSIQSILPGQEIIVIQMADWTFDPYEGKNLKIKTIRSPLMSCAAAKNLAARSAESKYIFFQDSDNYLIGEEAIWHQQVSKALTVNPKVIFLQRAEEDRKITVGVEPNRWNFSRHCINWSVIWDKSYFFMLDGFDETTGTGCDTLAQSGEEFTIFFRHFELSSPSIYLPELLVGHPSLNKPVTPQRKFEYAYGVFYRTMWQLRRKPSLMSLFWFIRSLAGFANDILHGFRSRSIVETRLLLSARLLAFFDALTRDVPRPRHKI